MTPEKVIQDVYDTAGEWIEMTPYRAEFVAGILAQRVVNLNGYIEYLEKRLDYANRQKNKFN